MTDDNVPAAVSKMNCGLLLLGSLLFCHAAGGAGALFMRNPAVWSWYRALAKPPICPPEWVFGAVWNILYTLLGVSLWLVLCRCRRAPGFYIALGAFGAQWLLNALWAPLFFGLREIGWAFADSVALLPAILATFFAFALLRKWAALLLLPYAFWVTFAAVLNGWLWWLNG